MKIKTDCKTKKIDTNYVFSENNQVYLKRKTDSKPSASHSIYTEEWCPISFFWKS